MKRSFLYMAGTLGAQLVAGAGLFVLLARVLTIDDFGAFAYSISLVAIAVAFIDFGYETALVRDAAREPERVLGFVRSGLRVKAWVGAAAMLVLMSYAVLALPDARDRALVALCALGQIAFSFARFHYFPFRAAGDFRRESLDAAVANAGHGALLLAVAFTTRSVLAVGAALAVSRSAYLLVARRRFARRFLAGAHVSPETPADGHLVAALRRGAPYAIDAIVVAQFVNVDAVILRHFVDDTTLGVYQGGARLVILVTLLPTVILNVLLPDLSRERDAARFTRAMRRCALLLAGLGVAACTPFFALSDLVVRVVYGGGGWERLAAWMPSFGTFLALRFLCMTPGIFLTVRGHQGLRALSNGAAVVLVLIVGPVLVERRGAPGMIDALCLSQLVLLAGYLVSLWMRERPLAMRVVVGSKESGESGAHGS